MHNVDEILAMNKKLSSKKEIKFTLDGCLSDLTKDRLSKIATSYGRSSEHSGNLRRYPEQSQDGDIPCL